MGLKSHQTYKIIAYNTKIKIKIIFITASAFKTA